MLKPNTLFVVGAGVSHEYGLPLGGSLKRKIANILPNQDAGNDRVRAAVVSDGVNEGMAAAAVIRRALPLSASIDNLIEHLAGDEAAVRAAKIGIVASILDAERSSDLYLQSKGSPFKEAVEESSLTALFRLIIGRSARDGLREAFKRVSFVTFNYDRCIEYYLENALVQHSQLDTDRAHRFVGDVKILHPYGQVGPIAWSGQGANGPVRFGERLENVDLRTLSGEIRTFSEEVRSELHGQLKGITATADRIIFLGCAPHPQNLGLLRPHTCMLQQAYGTMYVPAPEDPNRHVAPPMDEFAMPSALALKNTLMSWHHSNPTGLIDCKIEALTSRQLIAKYGSEWTAVE